MKNNKNWYENWMISLKMCECRNQMKLTKIWRRVKSRWNRFMARATRPVIEFRRIISRTHFSFFVIFTLQKMHAKCATAKRMNKRKIVNFTVKIVKANRQMTFVCSLMRSDINVCINFYFFFFGFRSSFSPCRINIMIIDLARTLSTHSQYLFLFSLSIFIFDSMDARKKKTENYLKSNVANYVVDERAKKTQLTNELRTL